MSRALLLAAAALLAAACQPLPQVMERSKASVLLALADSVGVEVGRIEGAPPELEDRLRRGLEAALLRRGLPASRSGRNRLSFMLAGQAAVAAADGGYGPVSLEWQLTAWDGGVEARFTQEARTGQADAVLPLLEALAEDVVRHIRSERRYDGPPAGLKISIAPEAGAELPDPLRRALETVLANQGLDVVPQAEPSHLHVFGGAEIGAVRAGLREVRLSWSMSWSDGREVGRVDQANVVPAELLAEGWAPIAAEAAAGAAEGLLDLVLKAHMALRRKGAAGARSRR